MLVRTVLFTESLKLLKKSQIEKPMNTKNKEIKDYTGKEFVITREFNAPREISLLRRGRTQSICRNGGGRAGLRIQCANGTRDRAEKFTT